MSNAGSSRIEIDKFNGKSFELWKLKMEDLLVDRDFWTVIEDPKPTVTAQKEGASSTEKELKEKIDEWEKLDRKARGLIRLCLADNVLVNVSGEKTAKDLWTKLETLYQSKSLVNKLFLRKKLYKLRMDDGSSFSAHLHEFNTLISQLSSINCDIKDDDKAITLLCSLPDSWDNLIIAIGSGTTELSFEGVVSALLSEDMRRQSMESSTKEALLVRGRSQDRNSKRPGNRSQSRGRSKSRDRSKIKCWKCNEFGHVKKDCKNKGGKFVNEKNDPGNKDEATGDLYLAAACVAQTDDDVWFIDTGASYHMTPHRDWFCQYETFSGGNVMLGNDTSVKIVGRGKVKLRMHDGTVKTLPGVMHIPDLTKNLISVSMMTDGGVNFSCDKNSCKMARGTMVIARGTRCGTLYKLLANTIKGQFDGSFVSEKEENAENSLSMLWHQRLGHISEKGLTTIASKKLVEGVPNCSMGFDFCEHCLYGKQNRVKFKSTATRATGVLDLIHSDLFGETPEASLGKSRYYVSFVDDFSRYAWVYFIRKKSEVLDKFREFKALVENQFNRKIKVLRTDNGREYFPVDQFCTEQGIARQNTIRMTPQQNGVAERLNRTLMEKARCMRSWAGLEPEFWAEAVATACYLKNRTPTSALKDQTPFEVLFGRKPSMSHARVFGCDAYVHVPKEKRNKLDFKSEKCKFIGYKEGVKGYKLWNPESRTVLYSRDVVFREIPNEPVMEKSSEKPDRVQIDVSMRKQVEAKNSQLATDLADDEPVEAEHDEEDGDNSDIEEEAEVEYEAEEEAEEEAESTLRRSTRVRRPPSRYSLSAYHALHVTNDEPSTVKEAKASGESNQWELAMIEEMQSLDKNQTWSLVKLPKDRKAIGCKWVFKRKTNAEGKVEKYKARLVAKGYSQIEGIDYGEIFSPVAKLTSIRTVLSAAAVYDLEVEQLDVKTAFLHGDLEEEIYMKQPDGFEIKGKEDLVCKLKKSLYGLKQSPRMWYQKFDLYVSKLGFTRCQADHCVYVKRLGDNFVILTLYVDDMLLIGNNRKMIKSVKGLLAQQFDMKDLGPANFILGMHIHRDRMNRKLVLGQKKYIEGVLKKFNMSECKPVGTPMATGTKLSADQCPKTKEEKDEMVHIPYASAVGSLMYAMVCTRPDIAQAVGVLSRYMSNPGKEHWTAIKRVFRYLSGTSDFALHFGGKRDERNFEVVGSVDADWGGDADGRKSTSGYVFNLFGGPVSWMSKKQSVVALSSTEAEYMALTHAGKEAIWICRLCAELGFKQKAVNLKCDSQSAIHLAKNPTFHSRSKHIDIQYHFIREKVDEKLIFLEKVDTAENIADFLTKAVTLAKFEWCTSEMGIKKYSPSGRMLGLAHTSVGSTNGHYNRAVGGLAPR